MRSLRRLSAVTFLFIAVLLAILVVTGFRQNSSMRDYDVLVRESESIIFLYATIREQATEGLLKRDAAPLLAAAKEFEELYVRYTALLGHSRIPVQYKLSFINKIDLEEVVINLRKLAENPQNDEKSSGVLKLLRLMNKQFLEVDRVVIGEMKNRVMGYQKQALILMGLIIALSCFSLIMLYQKSVKPLVDMARQAKQALTDREEMWIEAGRNSSIEVNALLDAFNQLLVSPLENNSNSLTLSRREAEFSSIVNEVTNRLNGIINYSQLLADYCEAEKVGGEQKEILYKIIENGEKGAEALQKGLHGGDV
jgi:hypothetical protein